MVRGGGGGGGRWLGVVCGEKTFSSSRERKYEVGFWNDTFP